MEYDSIDVYNLKRIIRIQREAVEQQIVGCEVDQFYERILNRGIDVDKDSFIQLIESFNKEQRAVQSGDEVYKNGLEVNTLTILMRVQSEPISCKDFLKELYKMGKYKALYEKLYCTKIERK